MKNIGRRKKVIKGRSVYGWFCLLLVLGFTAGLAVDARAEYTRPTTYPPTEADLLFIGGLSKTLVIQLLNLSPYTLTGDEDNITALSSLDKNRSVGKKSMFAPVGWPETIPGLEGEWSEGIWTPYDTNTTVHPYSFVVAWDDNGDYVENSTLGWTILGVHHYNPSLGTETKDIPLRMWFTRVKPGGVLRSELFGVISSTLKVALKFIGVAMEPSPKAVIKTFLALLELQNTAFKTANAMETASSQYSSDKMYFAAYTVPDCNSCGPSYLIESGTYGAESTDAVSVSWAPSWGDWQANLVVTTHILRGFDGPKDGIPPAYGFEDGAKVPMVAVTVWDTNLYMTAKGLAGAQATKHPLGLRLKSVLGTGDRARYTQFASLYKSLNPSQRRTLSEALDQWLSDQTLTQQQQMLLEKLVAAMENGQIKLPPANRKSGEKED